MVSLGHRLVVTLFCVASTVALASERKLPPITGELSGNFTALKMPGVPQLHWTATVRDLDEETEDRVITATIEGPGTRIRGTGNLTSRGEGNWQIDDGELELSAWFPAFVEKVDGMKGVVANGRLKIAAQGAIRAGVPDGIVHVSLDAGRLENTADGWALAGIRFTGEFAFRGKEVRVKSTNPFELSVGVITTARFGARNVLLRGVLNEDFTATLSESRIEIAGGEVTLDPTTVALAPFAIEATLHILNVGMQDLVALVPAGLSAAHGRIDGTLGLAWAAEGGFRIGAGNLVLGRSEPATVRLAARPGFLTPSMPKRFAPMPTWTGPFARWLSADNPAYTDMSAIELGEAALEVEVLTVRLTPEGDERGRTAAIHFVGRPIKADPGVKSVVIDVNVTGPLEPMLQLGLNRELSLEVR